MKSTEVYSELIDISKNLGIILRKVRGNFSSGLCFVNEKPYILLNKIADIDANISVLAKSISTYGVNNLYIKPILREIIEEENMKSNQIPFNEKL